MAGHAPGAYPDTANRCTESGTVDFGDHTTWYQVTTPADGALRAPLVVLHGGPGVPHNYLRSMTDLVDTGRAVVLYDQIGCGNSTHLPDAPTEFWNVELFVDELHNLVETLGLADGFHLLGQSWGGMLAPEYVLAHGDRVLSMTLSSSPASMDLWIQGTDSLRTRLSEDVQRTLALHEDAGSTEHPDYLAAMATYYRQFLCRLDPWPDDLQETLALQADDPTVYHTMIGPSEFYCPGTLHDWTVVDRLSSIAVPSLVLAGEYDEAQPICWEPFVQNIPTVRHHVFPDASHTPHLECRSDFNRAVADFLEECETQS
jgi:L-proline amide hydrolase